jgi:hypothetical protein
LTFPLLEGVCYQYQPWKEFAMSDCCTPVKAENDKNATIESCCTPTVAAKENGSAQPHHCPSCGQKGKKVDHITLKAMLNVSLLALRDTPYLFCRTTDCEVVYFSAAGAQAFTKAEIRVPVHQKEPTDETVPVCYCFWYSPATIRAEWLATGASTVIAAINGGIRAGQCACEVRNPQGRCCLGNVSRVVKQIEQEVAIFT